MRGEGKFSFSIQIEILIFITRRDISPVRCGSINFQGIKKRIFSVSIERGGGVGWIELKGIKKRWRGV